MISIIITAYKEPRTIGQAIRAFEEQKLPAHELIVVAPDDETLDEVKLFGKKFSKVHALKDHGKGKPAALNLAVKKAKGDILILSDGDVYVGKNSVEELVKPLEDKDIGAVSGRPISLDLVNTKYGLWAKILTETADKLRKKAVINNKDFFCSGYLFAIRKKLFPHLDEELLSEDGYISHIVYGRGYRISYAPKAEVYVKYPDNFRDWIKQKRRSAGGYNQIKKMVGKGVRSFSSESLGAFEVIKIGFKWSKRLSQLIWLAELFFARVYLWALIYLDVNIRKKSQKELWVRIESTK